MASRFSLASRPRLTVMRVGIEKEPVVQIDGMIADPQALVALAGSVPFEPVFSSSGGYPGLRAAAPRDYVQTIVRALIEPIAKAFDLGPIRPVSADCAFSLVTLPPDRLVPTQRAPHVDTTDPWQFAILHYLCDASFGGTGFYRHRATGFETLSEDRSPAYSSARRDEGYAPGYVEDGAPWFERIAEVSADYNRLIVYRSRLLHSGRILAPERLSPDPQSGRLTANIFATFAPAS